MKRLISATVVLLLLFASCSDDDPILEQSTSLKIVNDLSEDYYSITSVYLVGYEFKTLIIPKGDSQILILEDGMPAGYENINVVVNFRSSYVGRSVSAKININKGDITTITLTGRSGCEGCPGHSLKGSQ